MFIRYNWGREGGRFIGGETFFQLKSILFLAIFKDKLNLFTKFVSFLYGIYDIFICFYSGEGVHFLGTVQ